MPNPELVIALLRARLEKHKTAPSVVSRELMTDAITLLERAYPLPSCAVPADEALIQAQAKFLADNGMDGVNSIA